MRAIKEFVKGFHEEARKKGLDYLDEAIILGTGFISSLLPVSAVLYRTYSDEKINNFGMCLGLSLVASYVLFPIGANIGLSISNCRHKNKNLENKINQQQ